MGDAVAGGLFNYRKYSYGSSLPFVLWWASLYNASIRNIKTGINATYGSTLHCQAMTMRSLINGNNIIINPFSLFSEAEKTMKVLAVDLAFYCDHLVNPLLPQGLFPQL